MTDWTLQTLLIILNIFWMKVNIKKKCKKIFWKIIIFKFQIKLKQMCKKYKVSEYRQDDLQPLITTSRASTWALLVKKIALDLFSEIIGHPCCRSSLYSFFSLNIFFVIYFYKVQTFRVIHKKIQIKNVAIYLVVTQSKSTM